MLESVSLSDVPGFSAASAGVMDDGAQTRGGGFHRFGKGQNAFIG
jgi:hypothetical protein